MPWPARLAPGDHRREEDSRCDERRGHPEDGELHVPGAHQVERGELGQVHPEEAGQLRAVVLRGGTDQHLQHEQRRHHEEKPGAGPLRRGECHVTGRAEAQRGLLAPVPAEDVPAPKGREQQADAAQQRDQRQHRPDDHVGRRLVVHARLGRPVVGVRVVVAGPLGRARPGRPAEERGQRGQVVAIGDGVGAQTVLGAGLGEIARVVRHEPAVGLGLGLGELEHARPLVVTVGAEVLDRTPAGAIGALAAVAALNVIRGPAQIVRGVVGAQVGAVAEHRPVLHEAVVEEDLLAALDLALGVNQLTGGIDHPLGNRRLGLVSAVGQQPKYEEPEQHDQDNGLHPPLRHEQISALSGQTNPPGHLRAGALSVRAQGHRAAAPAIT